MPSASDALALIGQRKDEARDRYSRYMQTTRVEELGLADSPPPTAQDRTAAQLRDLGSLTTVHISASFLFGFALIAQGGSCLKIRRRMAGAGFPPGRQNVKLIPAPGWCHDHQPTQEQLDRAARGEWTANAMPGIADGPYSLLHHPMVDPPPRVIRGFSRKSRTRFHQILCAIPTRHVQAGIIFATLTYPRTWPGSWPVWKSQLDNFTYRVKRKFPHFWAYWKLEPQKRGAPHFHLLMGGIPLTAHRWWARSWYEAVGSGDQRHLRHGAAHFERCRSHRGVLSYAAKYIGKTADLPDDWQGGVGRFWGLVGRKNVGIEWAWVPFTRAQFWAATRTVGKLITHRMPPARRHQFHHPTLGCWVPLLQAQADRLVAFAQAFAPARHFGKHPRILVEPTVA